MNGVILGDGGRVKVGEIEVKEESVWDIGKKVGMVFEKGDK